MKPILKPLLTYRHSDKNEINLRKLLPAAQCHKPYKCQVHHIKVFFLSNTLQYVAIFPKVVDYWECCTRDMGKMKIDRCISHGSNIKASKKLF